MDGGDEDGEGAGAALTTSVAMIGWTGHPGPRPHGYNGQCNVRCGLAGRVYIYYWWWWVECVGRGGG